MLGYWPYAWKYFFWYICIFVTLRRKPGILNTRFVFLQYKNTKKTTKNTQKTTILLVFFFRGWVQLGPSGWAEPSRHSRVTGPNQWPGWAETHACLGWLLFKWIKFHLNSNNATKNACKAGKKRETAYLVCWWTRFLSSSLSALARCSLASLFFPVYFASVSLLSLSSVLFSFLTVMKGWRKETPSVLVLLEGKDGFCWFCYCDRGKVWLLLVPSLRLRKDMAAEEATARWVAQLVPGCCWCWPWFSRGHY
jgi:hypothetical protein